MPTTERPPSSERRRYHREERWFPVTIEVAGVPVWSICRDISPTGILVSARQTLATGTEVVLRFRLTPTDGEERVMHALVVRCEQNETELGLAFPCRLAIQFHEIEEALRGASESPAL